MNIYQSIFHLKPFEIFMSILLPRLGISKIKYLSCVASWPASWRNPAFTKAPKSDDVSPNIGFTTQFEPSNWNQVSSKMGIRLKTGIIVRLVLELDTDNGYWLSSVSAINDTDLRDRMSPCGASSESILEMCCLFWIWYISPKTGLWARKSGHCFLSVSPQLELNKDLCDINYFGKFFLVGQ